MEENRFGRTLRNFVLSILMACSSAYSQTNNNVTTNAADNLIAQSDYSLRVLEVRKMFFDTNTDGRVISEKIKSLYQLAKTNEFFSAEENTNNVRSIRRLRYFREMNTDDRRVILCINPLYDTTNMVRAVDKTNSPPVSVEKK